MVIFLGQGEKTSQGGVCGAGVRSWEAGSWRSCLCLAEPRPPVLQTLVYMFGDMLSNVGAAKKVFCYLDRKPDLPPPGTLAPPTLQGRVNFQNVSFAYPSRPDQPALQVPDRGAWAPDSLRG